MFVSNAALADTNSNNTVLKLKKSPRLWVSEDVALNLSDKLHSPYLQKLAKRVIETADELVNIEPLEEGYVRTNRITTRIVGRHMQCLTLAWVLTHDAKYRAAAIRHMGSLLNWNQISCEAGLHTPVMPTLPFCLRYGEQAADIALMYDLFRSDITPEEQKVFYDVLDRFHLKEALNCLDSPPWWANQSWSNWNGVCSGGMGMLALAFYEDRPECRNLIPFVEKSLGEYFKSFIKNGGGCHEGTGYWNYGMNYAMRYLLSWEYATGKKHPAFGIEEIRMSLHFPIDFTGITFGDNDSWGPLAMFFMLAKRLNDPVAALRAAAHIPVNPEDKSLPNEGMNYAATGDILYAADFIPTTMQMEKLKREHTQNKEPVARIYKGLDWAVLADDSAFPSLRLSARGGTSKITGHGHLDLLSFKCMINGEQMIGDQAGSSPVSYTSRGHHVYSRSAASKSSLFVDGLGCNENTDCKLTEIEKGDEVIGIRIDGSNIYLPRWNNEFIGRLFLMVENRYWLILDAAPGHIMESRFHTYAEGSRGEDWVLLKKGKEQLMMTFASLDKGEIMESTGMPTLPREQTRIFRWISPANPDKLHVTALNPVGEKMNIKLNKETDSGFAVEVSEGNSYQRIIRVTSELKLKK